MRHPPLLTGTRAVLILVAIALGCEQQEQQLSTQLKQQLSESEKQLRQVKKTNEALQIVIADQQKQIYSLQGLGERRAERLFTVEQIRLGRHTGGVNLDEAAGDDGIKVYIEPIDREGSIIKAAGEIMIQLYDLALSDESNLIGQYYWDADQLAGQWSSGFLTYHYSFVCEWKAGLPKHDEITVRAEFLDYLTGKKFTTQRLCKIRLPPAK